MDLEQEEITYSVFFLQENGREPKTISLLGNAVIYERDGDIPPYESKNVLDISIRDNHFRKDIRWADIERLDEEAYALLDFSGPHDGYADMLVIDTSRYKLAIDSLARNIRAKHHLGVDVTKQLRGFYIKEKMRKIMDLMGD